MDINEIILKSKKEKYLFIDISGKKLSKIPDFTLYNDYYLIKNIQYIFASENNIKEVCEEDFHQFPNLTVIDLSYNNIVKVVSLPQTIKQLSINNNKIKELPSIKNLELLEASNNLLTTLKNYEKLTQLLVDTNNLKIIPEFENVTYITCRNNKITSIYHQPKLNHLNCSYNNLRDINTVVNGVKTKINSIHNIPKINYLICSNNPLLKKLDTDMKYLETLEIENTDIKYLDYYPKLKYLTCSYSEQYKLLLDNRYKLKSVNKSYNIINVCNMSIIFE